MARSCGIHLGSRQFEMVVLDGGPKKQTLVAAEAGEFDPNSDNPARALKEVLTRLKVSKENVGLVINASSAAFRRVTLPLTDPAKIEQVLKFEVEKDLPQWDIDDVVGDYLVLADTEVSSDLLVTAVPKESLGAALDLCSKAGVEPYEAELETTAMVNAALYSGLCPVDSAQAFVHVGENSTSVVIVDAGKVNDMRVVHLGALGAKSSPAAEDSSSDDEETAPEESGAVETVDPEEVARQQAFAVARIRRELGRSISAARTRNPIESIHICGLEMPGLMDEPLMDIPLESLNAFGPDGSTVAQELPIENRGRWVAAFGAALRELGGGPLKPKLRREELTYAGTWERVEFPVAVCSLLLATLLAVMLILQQKELTVLNNYGAGLWNTWSNEYMLGQRRQGRPGKLDPPPQSISEFVTKLEDGVAGADGVPLNEDYLAATKRIDALLRREVADLKIELGADASLKQPQSALVGAHLILDLLDQHKDTWRPSIRKLEATTLNMAKSSQDEYVRIKLSMVLLAENAQTAASNYEALLTELSQQPWYKSHTRSNVVTLNNDQGLFIDNMPIDVDVSMFYEQQRLQALEASQ